MTLPSRIAGRADAPRAHRFSIKPVAPGGALRPAGRRAASPQKRARYTDGAVCQHIRGLAFLEHAPGMQHGHGPADLCDHAEIGASTNRMAAPWRCRSRSTNCRTWRCTVTSSAVVGLVSDHEARIAGERPSRSARAAASRRKLSSRIKLQHPSRFADRDFRQAAPPRGLSASRFERQGDAASRAADLRADCFTD